MQKRFEHVIRGNISAAFYRTTLDFRPHLYRYIKFIGNEYLSGMEAIYNFKKGHPFLDSFNKYINIIHESGIQEKILSDVMPQKYSNVKDTENVILSFEHVEGSFYILACGLITAIVIFIFELCFGPQKRTFEASNMLDVTENLK